MFIIQKSSLATYGFTDNCKRNKNVFSTCIKKLNYTFQFVKDSNSANEALLTNFTFKQRI